MTTPFYYSLGTRSIYTEFVVRDYRIMSLEKSDPVIMITEPSLEIQSCNLEVLEILESPYFLPHVFSYCCILFEFYTLFVDPIKSGLDF